MLETLVNRAAYDALPSDLQAIVEQCCEAANERVLAGFEARNARAVAALRQEHGVRFHALPADVVAALRRASTEVLEAAAAKDAFTRKVRDAFVAFQAVAQGWAGLSAPPR